MAVIEKLDKTIKELWKQDILNDYKSHFTYREDTLKNAFYYHLRRRLGDGYLKRHRLRIFTEFYLYDNNRADIAIVKLKPKALCDPYSSLGERVEDILAIIELKYKGAYCGMDPFYCDVKKMKKYIKIKQFVNCQFYFGFIHETDYPACEASWLLPRQQQSWAQGKVTELIAFFNENEVLTSYVLSYNGMNLELNDRV